MAPTHGTVPRKHKTASTSVTIQRPIHRLKQTKGKSTASPSFLVVTFIKYNNNLEANSFERSANVGLPVGHKDRF